MKKALVCLLAFILIFSGCKVAKNPQHNSGVNVISPKVDIKISGINAEPNEPIEGERVEFWVNLDVSSRFSSTTTIRYKVNLSLDNLSPISITQEANGTSFPTYFIIPYEWKAKIGLHSIEAEVYPLNFDDPDLVNNKLTQSFDVLDKNLSVAFKVVIPSGNSQLQNAEVVGFSPGTDSLKKVYVHIGNSLFGINENNGNITDNIDLTEFTDHSDISSNVLFLSAEGIIFFGAENGSFVSYDIINRKLLFENLLKDKPIRVQYDGALYATCEHENFDTPSHIIYKFDKSGNSLWSFDPKDRISLLTLETNNENIYFSSYSVGYPYLYSVNKNTGTLTLRENFYDFGCSAISRPVVDEVSHGSRAFILTDIGAMYFDLKSEKILWKCGDVTGTEAPLGFNLFYGGSHLVELDENAGKLLKDCEASRLTRKACCDELIVDKFGNNLIFARENALLSYNLDESKINLRGTLDSTDENSYDLKVDNLTNRLFVVTDYNNLYAFKLLDNSTKNNFKSSKDNQ
jgi:hypothetical protein